MRKLLLALFVFATFLSVNVNAKSVTAIIPDYTFTLSNSSVYYQDSEYPLLSYKNITYFPMTFDYCRKLCLTTSWDNEKGLYIAYQKDLDYLAPALPIYPTTANQKRNYAEIPEYNIYINGKLFDNKNTEYPFLNFRGVTYCPVTWDLSYNEFNWNVIFTGTNFSVAPNYNNTKAYQYSTSLPDGFVVYSYIQEPMLMENGTTAIVNKPYYEKFDYATQTLMPYPEGSQTPVRQYIRHDGELKPDGYYLNGQLLTEINLSIDDPNHSLYALEYSLAGKSFYEVNHNHKLPSSDITVKTTYHYIDVYGNLKYIGQNLSIPTAVSCADGNVYFNTCQTSMSFAYSTVTSPAHKLYRLSPNGEFTFINGLFPNYGSMEILGEVNGIMYLRCVWMPHEYTNVSVHDVSPLNDGYFTYNGKDLVKLYNYIYADRSVLSPTGEIYGIFNRLGQIKKIN